MNWRNNQGLHISIFFLWLYLKSCPSTNSNLCIDLSIQSILVTPLICTFASSSVPAWEKKKDMMSTRATELIVSYVFLVLLWWCSASLVDTEIAGISKTTVLSEREMIKIQASGN